MEQFDYERSSSASSQALSHSVPDRPLITTQNAPFPLPKIFLSPSSTINRETKQTPSILLTSLVRSLNNLSEPGLEEAVSLAQYQTTQPYATTEQNKSSESVTEVTSLATLHDLFTVSNFKFQIDGRQFKLDLNEEEVLTMRRGALQLQVPAPITQPTITLSPISTLFGFNALQLSAARPPEIQVECKPLKVKITLGGQKASSIGTSPLFTGTPSVRLLSPKLQIPLVNVNATSLLKNLIARQPSEPYEQSAPQQDLSKLNAFLNNLEVPKMPKEETDAQLLRRISSEVQKNLLKSRKTIGRPQEEIFKAFELPFNRTSTCIKDNFDDRQYLKKQIATLQEQLKQKDSGLQSEPSQDYPLHVGFLYSSPLFLKEREGKYTEVDQLNFQDESRAIQAAAQESKTHVCYLQAVATKDNFTEMLARKPKALHISCHGIQKDSDDFLLLELKGGEGELISKKRIGQILIKYSVKLDLVFVAACKSQFVGSMFQKAGVKHVICVREGAEILDTAVLNFTNRFYKEIFSGQKICDAFAIAQNEVEVINNSKGQAKMFTLLLEDELPFIESLGLKPARRHTCVRFGPLQQGSLQDLTDQVDIEHFPVPQKRLIGRESDLFKLVKTIQTSGKRLTLLIGMPGIGKSSLVRDALHYLNVRKQFLGGIVLINAKGVETTEILVKILVKEFLQEIQDESVKSKIREAAILHPESLLDQIKNYIKSKQDIQTKTACGGIFGSQSRKFLLVIDNAEVLIQKSAQSFKHLINDLTKHCSLLQIVVTTRKWLIMEDIVSSSHEVLSELQPPLDIELFMEVAGKIDNREIYELLTQDADYPMGALNLKQPVESWSSISDKAKEELLNKLLYYRHQVEILKEHEFFNQMNGNPHSITLMACLRANPLVKRNLCELHNLVKSENIKNLLAEEDVDSEVFSNDASLRVSHEISLLQLQQREPDAYLFYFFMGLLPGGAQPEQLTTMWGESWQKGKETLDKFGFLENEKTGVKIVLKPFLITYAEESIDEVSKDKYSSDITQYYGKEMKEIYRYIGRKEKPQESSIDTDSVLDSPKPMRMNVKDQSIMFVLGEIRNIQSCLKRYFDKIRKMQDFNIEEKMRKDNYDILNDSRSDIKDSESYSSGDSSEPDACFENFDNHSARADGAGEVDEKQITANSRSLQQMIGQSFGAKLSKIEIVRDDKPKDKAAKTSVKQVNLLSVPVTGSTFGNKSHNQLGSTFGNGRPSPLFIGCERSHDSEGKLSGTFKHTSNRSDSPNPVSSSFKLGPILMRTDKWDGKKNVNVQCVDNESTDSLVESQITLTDRSTFSNQNPIGHSLTFVFKMDRTQTMRRQAKQQNLNRQSTMMHVISEKIAMSFREQLQTVNDKSDFKITRKKTIYSNIADTKVINQATSFEIRPEGQFALYCMATMYFLNDFQAGLQLSSQAESIDLCKSSFLFQANSLRLHALFLEQMYEHDLIGQCSLNDNQTKIHRAIQYVRKALNVFNPTPEKNQQPSVHGIALSQFHLGYLYSKYASQLLVPAGFENMGPHDYRVLSVVEARLIALEFFEKAFFSFEKLNHLAGMCFSRLEASTLCGLQDINNEEKHIEFSQDYSKYEQLFEAYEHLDDEKCCSYVPRDKNRNSLLTELAMNNRTENHFKPKGKRSSQLENNFLIKEQLTKRPHSVQNSATLKLPSMDSGARLSRPVLRKGSLQLTKPEDFNSTQKQGLAQLLSGPTIASFSQTSKILNLKAKLATTIVLKKFQIKMAAESPSPNKKLVIRSSSNMRQPKFDMAKRHPLFH